MLGDVNLCHDSDLNLEYLEYNERQTKTRTGDDIRGQRDSKPRMYATNITGRCPVETYKIFADHRPIGFSNAGDPFYLATITHLQNPKVGEKWFLRGPVGKNKLNTLMKTMAKKANLPDLENKRITNSSARKRLCQTLLSHNIPDTQAIHVTGHKNPQSLNNYRQLTNRQKFAMSNILSGAPQLAQVEDSRPLHSGTDDYFSVPSRDTLVNLDLHRSINIQNTRNDSEASFRSVFYGANIYGGSFNVNVHFHPNDKQ